MPNHVAIIMDGNRRFAKEFGLSTTEGHVKGKDKLEEVMEWCRELGIKILNSLCLQHREPQSRASRGRLPDEALRGQLHAAGNGCAYP